MVANDQQERDKILERFLKQSVAHWAVLCANNPVDSEFVTGDSDRDSTVADTDSDSDIDLSDCAEEDELFTDTEEIVEDYPIFTTINPNQL